MSKDIDEATRAAIKERDAIQKAARAKAARIEREEIAAFEASEAGVTSKVKDMRARMRRDGRDGGPEAERLQAVGDSLDTLNTVISSALRIPPTTMRFDTTEVTELTDDGVQTRDKLQVGALVSSLLTAQTGATVGSALREVATHHGAFREAAAIMGDEERRNQVLAAPETVEMLAYRAASVGNYLDRHRDTVAQTVAMNVVKEEGDARDNAELRVRNTVTNHAIPLVSNVLATVEANGEALAGPVSTIINEAVLRPEDGPDINVDKVVTAGLQAAAHMNLEAVLSGDNIAHIRGVMSTAYQTNAALRETLANSAGIKNAAEFETALDTVDKALGMVGHHQDKLLAMAPAIVALATAPVPDAPDAPDAPVIDIPPALIPKIIGAAGEIVTALDKNPEVIASVGKILDAVAPPGPEPDFAARVTDRVNPDRAKYHREQRGREEALEAAKVKEASVSTDNSAIETAQKREAEALAAIEVLETERQQLQLVRERQQQDIDRDMQDVSIKGIVKSFDDRKKLLEEKIAGFRDNPIADAPAGSELEDRLAVRMQRAERRKLEDELKRINEGVLDVAKDKDPYTLEAKAQRVIKKRMALEESKVLDGSLEFRISTAKTDYQEAQAATKEAEQAKSNAIQEAQSATKVAEQAVQQGEQAEKERVDATVAKLKAEYAARVAKHEEATVPAILDNVKGILSNKGFQDALVDNAQSLSEIAVPIVKQLPVLQDYRTQAERDSGAQKFDAAALDDIVPLAAGAIEVAARNPQVLDGVKTLIDVGAKTAKLEDQILSAKESEKPVLEAEKLELEGRSAEALGGVLDVAQDVLKNHKVKTTLVDKSESVGAVAAQVLVEVTSKNEKERVEAEYLKEVKKKSAELTTEEKDELNRRTKKAVGTVRNARGAVSKLAAGAVEVVGSQPKIIDGVKAIIQTGAESAKLAHNLEDKTLEEQERKSLEAQLKEVNSKNNAALVGVIKSAKAVVENPKVNEVLQKNGGKVVDVVASFLPEKGLVTRKMVEEAKPALSNVVKAVAKDPKLVDTVANALETLDKGGIFKQIGAFRDIARNKDLNAALKDNSQGLAEVAAKIFAQGRDTSKMTPEQQSKAFKADVKKANNLLKAVADLHQPTWNRVKKIARFSRVAFNALRLTGSITKLVKHLKEESKQQEAVKVTEAKARLAKSQSKAQGKEQTKSQGKAKEMQQQLQHQPVRGQHTARVAAQSRGRDGGMSR